MFPEATEPAMRREEGGSESELPAIMARYQAGEPEAIEELVRRLSPRLLSFLGTLQPNRADAEDILQDCWVRIHRSRHTYRSPEPVLPWIFAIARHTRLDAYRRRRRRDAREVLVATPPEILGAPSRAVADAGQLIEMLDSLPESQREVLVMLKVSGMSLKDVARATSSTVGAIKQKAHRAYETLRLGMRKTRL